MHEKIEALRRQLCQVIRGKEETVELLLTAFAAEGSVLLQDVPGVGKTTLAKSLAACLQADFRRIQFTPDLLPSDIIGGAVYNPKSGEMHFRPGPVFANVVLADEINRASPRTQSALLEAMSEKQVSADGVTYPLPRPFLVLATENPIEYQGTYNLPEAQLDRFAMRLSLGYPDDEAEFLLLKDRLRGEPSDALSPVLTCEEVQSLQEAVRQVHLDDSLIRYTLSLVAMTRQDDRLTLGISPRGSLHLTRCAQALALLDGRDYVQPDDIKRLAVPVLAHRLVLSQQAIYSGLDAPALLGECLKRLHVPR